MAMLTNTSSLADSHLERLRQANRDIGKGYSDITSDLADIRRTGQGTGFSTVMGDLANQAGRITQSHVMDVAMSDGPLYVALRDIYLHPGAPVGTVQHQESVARVVSQFSSAVASQAAMEEVASLMFSFQSELARMQHDIDILVSRTSSRVDALNLTAKQLHGAAVEFYDDQFPMAADRIKVIDRFVDDREWVGKVLTRKNRQESIVAAAQDAVERLQQLYPDSAHRTRLVRDEQQKRRDSESEIQSLEDSMIRRLRGYMSAARQRVQVKSLEFTDAVKTDGGVAFAACIREYMVGREHLRPIVHVFMRRALGDYDPVKCTFYLYQDSDIEESWRSQFNRENEELATDLLHALEKVKIPSPVGTPVPYGLEGKQSFTAQPGNGMHILFAMQCQWYSVRAMYQETVMNRITDAAEHFRGGNPAIKIQKIVRPAMKEALRLQLQVKAVNTLHPMLRILNKRDDGFKQLSELDRYKEVVPNVNCSGLLMQFLSDVERVCEDLVADAKVSADVFWRSNKVQGHTDVHMKKAFKAHYEEEELDQDQELEEEAYYDAEQEDDDYSDEEDFEYSANFGKGKGGRRGKGVSKGKGKSSKGGKGRGFKQQRPGYVPCDCQGCWNHVKANSSKRWGHICGKCVGWAVRNERDSYRNRRGEMVKLEGATSGGGFVATDRERALAKTVMNAVSRQDRQPKANMVAVVEPKFHDAEEPSAADEQAMYAQMAKRQRLDEDVDGTMSGCMQGLINEHVDLV